MIRRTALLASAALALAAAPHAGAAAPAVKVPVVTVIDTGLNARHQEFDYRGSASTTDQVVAWWDFTAEKKGKDVFPGPGQTWDTQVADPYDPEGHGTLTAGMAVGRNASPQKTPSAYPGGKLAMAKVFTGPGATLDLTALAPAIRWAVDTVHSDVISISIGSSIPSPTSFEGDVYAALSYARRHGALVVVSNGNGFGNLGALTGDPGWASNFSSSPDVLAVGAADASGLFVSTDPEVAAAYTVTGPSNQDRTSYVENSGTSFAAPYVAGFAAAALLASRQGGHPLGVDALEQFVKDSSTDTAYPPQTEGYGVLRPAQVQPALRNAKAGRLPSRPSPDWSALYVDGVAGTLRALWSAT